MDPRQVSAAARDSRAPARLPGPRVPPGRACGVCAFSCGGELQLQELVPRWLVRSAEQAKRGVRGKCARRSLSPRGQQALLLAGSSLRPSYFLEASGKQKPPFLTSPVGQSL